MRDFKKLIAWQKAHDLTLDLYRDTAGFPITEKYGLAAQLRRSGVSIASNIAEGAGRRTRADYARFLDMALGSANEVEYQLLLAKELGFLEDSIYENRVLRTSEIRRACVGLRRAVLERTGAWSLEPGD